ncbi:putative rna-binding protein lupus la protein [Venturia nashicola]|uniref:Putative rna-binding protein lupus la protein n=1 Tax=Venturia nashicola TaxID=86259 RepID=A0A4Z1P9I4_9PEZI|nr:putative rna-binding protein lupus la protein [Venturia nashicola]
MAPKKIPSEAPAPIQDRLMRKDAIRDKFDYYFSAEYLNSPQGARLKNIISDSHNRNTGRFLIPLGCFARWKSFKLLFPSAWVAGSPGPKFGNVEGKEEIMEALQTSKTVNVVDTKHIERKYDAARYRLQTNQNDSDGGEDGAWDLSDNSPLYVAPSFVLPVKKMSEVTGLEKDYADAPITPAEHQENLDCYHPDRQIHDRLEVAIQRFKARRKFHTSHSTAFNAWLKFGGVETGDRKFNGKFDEKEKLEGMSAFDKAIEFATHQVGDDKGDPKLWVVDFVGVAEAFLSSELHKTLFDPDAEQIDLVCGIMTNFYNYILHHDVCPEYQTEIFAARAVVKLGRNQLIAIHKLGGLVPGDFNVACSVLLDGSLAGTRGVSYAVPEVELEAGDIAWNPIKENLLTAEKARAIIKMACTSSLASDQLFDAVAEADLSNIMSMDETFELGLEVVEIHPPTQDDIEGYNNANMDEVQVRKNVVLKPLGKLVCKTWKIPAFVDHDLPKHLRDLTFKDAPKTFTFWVEGDIIDHMFWESKEEVLNEKIGKMEKKDMVESFVGMKMSARVRRLKVKGVEECLWVLDGVNSLYCSFYNLILNDLMPHPWKGVRLLTNEEQGGSEDGSH